MTSFGAMPLHQFLAQSDSSDPSFLKWLAVTAMVIGFFNSILWVVYLVKEITHKRHVLATAADLVELEQALNAKIGDSTARLDRVEDAVEKRILRIYDQMQHNAELVGKSMQTIAQDVARIQGELSQ